MNGRQSLFDVLETYTVEDFAKIIAVKVAEEIALLPPVARRGKGRKVVVQQPKDYYTTKEVAEMFGCDTRRVTEACRYGRFPPYVKGKNKGRGLRGGYHFEKSGIERLFRECPKHFTPVDCWGNALSNQEANA